MRGSLERSCSRITIKGGDLRKKSRGGYWECAKEKSWSKDARHFASKISKMRRWALCGQGQIARTLLPIRALCGQGQIARTLLPIRAFSGHGQVAHTRSPMHARPYSLAPIHSPIAALCPYSAVHISLASMSSNPYSTLGHVHFQPSCTIP